MTTKLGQKIAAGGATQPAAGVSATALGRRLANGRRGETVDIPGLGPAYIELVGAVRWEELELEGLLALKARGLELELRTAEVFELSKARRTLAEAVRDPDDHSAPFGTLAEWGALDPLAINAAWQAYGDIRERLDPQSTPLTDEERLAIDLAVKKKDVELLRSYGVARLSAWLVTTGGPQSTSPTPSSSSSAS